MTACSDLKALIRNQVGGEVIKDNFDVGYLQGNNVITMRNKTYWSDGLTCKGYKHSRLV